MLHRPPQKSTRNQSYNRRPLADYPVVTLSDGSTYHVDEMGLIAGRRPLEPPPPAVDVLACMSWLEQRVSPRNTPSVCTYGVKHAASRWLGRYLTNGAMIVAADRAGFSQDTGRSGGYILNTVLGVSLPSYRRLPEVSGIECLATGQVMG